MVGVVMEKELAKQIRQLIESRGDGSVEIAAATFVKIWGKPVMENLLRFSKENGFGYVSIIQPGNRFVSVRFWKIKGKYLLEEPDELQD
jgi:hypothetical protein